MTKEELEEGRYEGYRIYGYLHSYCKLTRSCEVCDRWIRIGCKFKRAIEEIQIKRILSICKSAERKDNGQNG